MNNFRTIDRQTGFLLPPSVDEWLPEKHLARFVVEVIDGMDLRAMSGSYRGSGSVRVLPPEDAAGHSGLWLRDGDIFEPQVGACAYDSVAFRFIAANDHPDHDTIATFRRRFLKQIEGLFVQVLLLAREMGMLRLGILGLDGTKIRANASRHSALSYEHAGKIEAQLKAEVAELTAKAEAADKADIPDGVSIPDELARREDRLQKIAETRAKIEARASAENARRQEALCSAQTDPGTGVRHHQIGTRIPPVLAARARQGARRVEPRDHGMEHQADVHPQRRLMRPARVPAAKKSGHRAI